MIKDIKTGLSLLCLASLVFIQPAQAKGPAAPGKAIVGTWMLVRDVNKAPDGTEKSLFGDQPQGQIIFTSNGRYASLNARADLPKFAAGNRMGGTAEEYKAVAQGSIATFGHYKVSADGKTLSMTPEASTYPNWSGTEQQRALTLAGDEMSYALQASVGGVSTLTYRRVK
ncbi:MAG: lipocalin-like domain-containing protein [Pseudomonadota bacterium]